MKKGAPTSVHVRYFGICPKECKTNEQIAMTKLKAKRAFRAHQILVSSFPAMLKLSSTYGCQQCCIWVTQMDGSSGRSERNTGRLGSLASWGRSASASIVDPPQRRMPTPLTWGTTDPALSSVKRTTLSLGFQGSANNVGVRINHKSHFPQDDEEQTVASTPTPAQENSRPTEHDGVPEGSRD